MSLVVQGEPYINFINSLKSKETKSAYSRALLRFTTHYQASLQQLVSLSPKDIEQMVTSYITNMNARGLSHGYVNLDMSAIFHFFDMNDIVLNKRKISKFVGEHKKMHKDRGYRHEEIKLLADVGDFRFKALVYLLAATGIRLGSINSLLVRHLERKGDIYKITIYENSKEEHFVFTTPEATRAIDDYLDYRRRSSEVIKPDSPLFRNDFNVNSIAKVRKNSKPISRDTLRNILYARLIKVGLIEKPVGKDNHNPRRNQVPMSHGFRKFWMNQAVKAKMQPEIREMLLNHRIGIASAYYRPTEDEMLEEFMKAANNLTINEESRLKRKVTELTEKQDEITLMKLSHQKEMKEMRGQLDKIVSIIQENPKLAKVKKEVLSEI